MKGYFINLTKNEIVKSPPVHHSLGAVDEYISKIKFYLPQLLPLINGEKECEEYPRRTLYAFNSPCGMCDYANLCLHGDLMGYTIETKKERDAFFLSPTQLLRYETCPRQWAYSMAGYRTEARSAKLLFGESVHNAIEAYIILGTDPKDAFSFFWGEYKDAPLSYSKKEDYEYLKKYGCSIMAKFPAFYEKEIVSELGVCEILTETPHTKLLWDNFAGWTVYLTCKPDLVCKTRDGDTVIIDWKTSSKKTHDESWLPVADQLTAYFLLLL